jgi:hypothetical protein
MIKGVIVGLIVYLPGHGYWSSGFKLFSWFAWNKLVVQEGFKRVHVICMMEPCRLNILCLYLVYLTI